MRPYVLEPVAATGEDGGLREPSPGGIRGAGAGPGGVAERGARPVEESAVSLLATPLGRLRAISAVEGLSYVLLVGVAMPLKYLAGMPEAVRVVGMAHGVLFVAFVLALLLAWHPARLGLGRVLGVFALSVVPLGAIGIEVWLRRYEARAVSPG